MSNTELFARWGAGLSTVVFAWDVYKWRTSGPRIRFAFETGMEAMDVPEYQGKTIARITVTNYGSRPTTLKNVGYLQFVKERFPSKIRRRIPFFWKSNQKPDWSAVIFPRTKDELPFELRPGSIWVGLTEQNLEIEQRSKQSGLYCYLWHSHSEKPLRRRVRVRSELKK